MLETLCPECGAKAEFLINGVCKACYYASEGVIPEGVESRELFAEVARCFDCPYFRLSFDFPKDKAWCKKTGAQMILEQVQEVGEFPPFCPLQIVKAKAEGKCPVCGHAVKIVSGTADFFDGDKSICTMHYEPTGEGHDE